jgi:hypothetical protein
VLIEIIIFSSQKKEQLHTAFKHLWRQQSSAWKVITNSILLGKLTITLMKHESCFDINASIYEYLNQNSNLRNVEDKAMYLEYEKYIHFLIEEQQVRCSNVDFYLTSNEEDHSLITI